LFTNITKKKEILNKYRPIEAYFGKGILLAVCRQSVKLFLRTGGGPPVFTGEGGDQPTEFATGAIIDRRNATDHYNADSLVVLHGDNTRFLSTKRIEAGGGGVKTQQ